MTALVSVMMSLHGVDFIYEKLFVFKTKSLFNLKGTLALIR
jgi:hypothetical protein